MSQIKTIHKILGKVFNENKKPISGALITIKGNSKIATSTNNYGEFILSPDQENATLTISSIGYTPVEVKLSKDTKLPLIITLTTAQAEIDEVVVTGYGNRQKESFTKEELQRVGNKNVLQSFQNLDPSFVLGGNLSLGSNPNALPDIQLRGQSGLDDIRGEYAGNPNEPLFIVDGFEENLQKIYDLDMNRVSSITLLKDASAKAANGISTLILQ